MPEKMAKKKIHYGPIILEAISEMGKNDKEKSQLYKEIYSGEHIHMN